MGWTEFAAAFAVFFVTHSVPVRPAVRPRIVAKLGHKGFTLAYSVLSLGVLVWLVGAARRAPFVELWPWAAWQNAVPLIVMPIVCLVVALAIGRPNPFSFGGRRDAPFDPGRPGLVRYTRHPLLAALALWALAHLVPNGDLAHVLLFGSFAGFALLGGRLVDRRRRREMGDDWDRLRREVAAASCRPVPATWRGVVVRLAIGAAIYLALLRLHPWLFGVDPLV